MKKYGSIYIIKNNINDKVYIGQTTNTIEERFKNHIKKNLQLNLESINYTMRLKNMVLKTFS